MSKLEWLKGRESDIQYADALRVAVAQRESLDVEYLERWARELGIENMLSRLLKDAKERAKRADGFGEHSLER